VRPATKLEKRHAAEKRVRIDEKNLTSLLNHGRDSLASTRGRSQQGFINFHRDCCRRDSPAGVF
jgi:hypothetical protein